LHATGSPHQRENAGKCGKCLNKERSGNAESAIAAHLSITDRALGTRGIPLLISQNGETALKFPLHSLSAQLHVYVPFVSSAAAPAFTFAQFLALAGLHSS